MPKEYQVPISKTTQRPQSRARERVDLVRLTMKHRAERTSHVIVIEHAELNAWINHSRAHGFSFEAESMGPSEVGTA